MKLRNLPIGLTLALYAAIVALGALLEWRLAHG